MRKANIVKLNSCRKYNVKKKRESEEEESTTVKEKNTGITLQNTKNTRIWFVQFIWKINYDICKEYEE